MLWRACGWERIDAEAAHLISLNGSVKLIQSKGPENARLLSANACVIILYEVI